MKNHTVCDFIVEERKPNLLEMKEGIPQGMVKPCHKYAAVKKIVYNSLVFLHSIIESDVFTRFN